MANSYIKSPEWIVNKKGAINVKNKNDHCFEYSIIVALHHQSFKNHPKRLSNIHHFYSCLYNWEGIEFLAGITNWKRFDQNNTTIALNEKTINLAYKSKYNRKRRNQVVLLMITNGKK